MPAYGIEVILKQVEKYNLIKDLIIGFLGQRNFYEGSIKSLGKEMGYTRPYKSVWPTDVTNSFFIFTFYALIAENYVACDKPFNFSKKRTVKLTLTEKGKEHFKQSKSRPKTTG